MFTAIPKIHSKKDFPRIRGFFYSEKAKQIRILISSILFGAIHLGNLEMMGKEYTYFQTVSAFCAGIYLGTIYEKKGLAGAIAAHGTNNLITCI